MFCTILGNLDASVTGIDYFLLYPFHFISHYDGIFLIGIQFQFIQQSTAFHLFDSQYGKPLIMKFLNGIKRILFISPLHRILSS